jgi:YHS domain-containing protein
LVQEAAPQPAPLLEPMSTSTLFAPLFRPLFVDAPRPEADLPPSRTLHDIEGELETVAHEAETRRQDAATKAAEESAVSGTGGVGLSEVARTAARQRVWKEERDALVALLENEIVDLHSSLGTGISRDVLPRLRLLLASHDPEAFVKPEMSIEEQIEGSVLGLLARRTGERAWERVNELMLRIGMSWPIPEGLERNRSAEELQAALSQHDAEARTDFVTAAAQRLSGLICGEVLAWKSWYPPPGSSLWKKTALFGVAAGLRGQLFAAALETWMWRPPDLEARLLATLDAELNTSRKQLETDPGSLRAAVDVAARVADVCGTVVPNTLWEFVEPHLSWDGPGPTVMSLADGLRHVDPVCGKSLSAEEVRARSEREGVISFFCSEACAESFRNGLVTTPRP